MGNYSHLYISLNQWRWMGEKRADEEWDEQNERGRGDENPRSERGLILLEAGAPSRKRSLSSGDGEDGEEATCGNSSVCFWLIISPTRENQLLTSTTHH